MPVLSLASTVKRLICIVVYTALLAFSAPSLSVNEFDLPDFGDRSELTLPRDQQIQIGKAYLRQLYRNPDRIDDPELLAYMSELGERIARNADLDFKLTFNLINNDDINAFAVPGGHITFYSGLFTASENESELASVMAHEIAHVSQKHLPRLIAKLQAQQLPATAAIIASILVGGDVGLAGATLTNAQVISNQLRYSRGFEREADAVGIRLLDEAGFNPKGMPGFFGKLERQARIQNERFFEFLQTHPLSFTRIAESNARADKIGARQVDDSQNYLFMRTKLKSQYARDPKHARLLYEKQRQDNITSAQQKLLANYALAYIYSQMRDFDEAHNAIDTALTEKPNVLALKVAKAQIHTDQGQYTKAIQLLDDMIAQNPDVLYLNEYLINALLLNGDGERARQRVRFLLRREAPKVVYYDYLKRANQLLENYTQAAQADAESLAMLGYYTQAIDRLQTALTRLSEDDTYYRSSIEARLSQLKKTHARLKN